MARATRFFTPPPVAPVSLDLAELGGGGSCPTQFEGKTTDGRAVYVRYRGGGLTIDVATAPGRGALDGGERVLDVDLGPAFDGYISLQQFLRLTGLTVPHPIPSDDEDETELDLTGRMTFWRGTMLPTTSEGATALVEALRKRVPRVVQNVWSNGKRSQVALPTGARPTQSFLEFVPGNGLPVFGLQYRRFQYDFPGYGGDGDDERLGDKLGCSISVAGSRDSALKFDNLSVSADFPTDDAAARAFLDELSAVFDAHYPVARYMSVDPVTGTRLAGPDHHTHEDPRITNWIAAEPDRFRFVQWDRDTERYVGLRPELNT